MLGKMLLAALACSAPAAAQADWQKASSDHFTVYSDDSARNVQAFTTRLERFDKAVRTALNIPEINVGPDARVIVFVVADTSDVQRLVDKNMGNNIAGFYNTDHASGPFAVVPRKSAGDGELSPLMILQHEYTHHIMYSNWGDVVFPTWFSEGFAELFATARVKDDGSVLVGAVPLYRTYGIDQMNTFPVERLVRDYPNYRDGLQTQVFYGRSWLLTHYLMFDGTRAKQLGAYIGAINSGKTPAEAAQTLGVTPSLDLKMNSYLKRPALPAMTLTPAQLPIGPVTVRPLTRGEAAVMPTLMRSHNGVDKKGAQQVIALARAAAAPFPNDAGAQNELAEAEYDAGNLALSEAAADRALAADPKSVHALIYKGMAQVAIAKKAATTDAATWTTARRWFLAANKVDPLYAWPVQLYYESFEAAKQTPTQAAKDALLYGYKIAPTNLELRQEAARVLLRDGNAKAARTALEPIAYNEHGSDGAEVAKKAIAALDASGTASAMKVLDDAAAKAKEDAAKGKDAKKA